MLAVLKVSVFPFYGSSLTLIFDLFVSQKGNVPERIPLPPPTFGAASFNGSKLSNSTSFQYGSASFSSSKPSHPTGFSPSVPPNPEDSNPISSAPSAPSSNYDNRVR